MSSEVTNYQCPACAGALKFSSGSEDLVCEYCGSHFAMQEIETFNAQKEAEAAEAFHLDKMQDEWIPEGMRAYSCPGCGAQLICDETTAATSCPYCGNPAVVPGQFTGSKRPDYVIPFKLDKNAAVGALKQHYRGKLLLPKEFTSGSHIDEVKGVYVPFWMFDLQAEAEILFHGTRSRSHREGDYIVTVTQHYDIDRAGGMDFQRIPVDASSKMPDDYMDSIEPFHYEDLKEFSTAYLPGFLADKYDVEASQAIERADQRCRRSTFDALKDTVSGYESVDTSHYSMHVQKGDMKYALMPVWLLSTRWKGKNYLFAMNGQTGKMVGKLPEDQTKTRIIFWSTAVVLSVLLSTFFAGTFGGWVLQLLN